MNTKKNYTIVFQNEKKGKTTLQMAGKNLLGDDTSISDYYNNKFKKEKKPMDHIVEEENDDDTDQNTENKKIDNFVNSAKKMEKKIKPTPNKQKNISFEKRKS